MSLLSVLKAGIEFKRNFAKNNTDCERAGTLLECQGGLRFSLWSVESYRIYTWRFAKGGLKDWAINAVITNTGITSSDDHPHYVELTTSMQLHTSWYMEYLSTVWHLWSFVNCDNWEMMGLLEAIIQELDIRGRCVSSKGYMQYFSFLNCVCRYCVAKKLKPCIH